MSQYIKTTLLLLIIIAIFILAYNIEVDYSKAKFEAYAEGELQGLKDGFDEGFISGNHFTTGQYMAIRNDTVPEKYFDWYTMEGYRSMTVKNYTRPSMNPYINGRIEWNTPNPQQMERS